MTLALLLGGCGDDAPSVPADPYPTVTPSTAADDVTPDGSEASTAADSSTSTTTTAAPATGTTVTAQDIESDDGTTGSYELTLSDDGQLCFEASLSNDDPDVALGLGTGISECADDDYELTALENTLLVSVGAVDGNKRYGYVWGAASPAVSTLRITFDEGEPVPVEVHDARLDVGVFAIVVDTVGRGTAQTLEGLDEVGNVVATESVRSFLRAGAGYPEVAPPVVPSTTYPTTGG